MVPIRLFYSKLVSRYSCTSSQLPRSNPVVLGLTRYIGNSRSVANQFLLKQLRLYISNSQFALSAAHFYIKSGA
jgi:hypothetical protein